MKKLHLEFFLALAFVLGGTLLAYLRLAAVVPFWSAQEFWSTVLIVGWMIVALGYYHQGWTVRRAHSATHVSRILPLAVFVVQCVLFVKGVYYRDWSLVAGAVLVNSGVVFALYQIWRAR